MLLTGNNAKTAIDKHVNELSLSLPTHACRMNSKQLTRPSPGHGYAKPTAHNHDTNHFYAHDVSKLRP